MATERHKTRVQYVTKKARPNTPPEPHPPPPPKPNHQSPPASINPWTQHRCTLASDHRAERVDAHMPTKVTPKTIESQKRVVEALNLRAMGLTYQQIADTPYADGPGGTMYGGDRHNARRDIVAAYEDTIKEPADEVRQMEIIRLDKMLAGLVDKGLFEGELDVVKVVISLSALRATLC